MKGACGNLVEVTEVCCGKGSVGVVEVNDFGLRFVVEQSEVMRGWRVIVVGGSYDAYYDLNDQKGGSWDERFA